MEFTFSHTTNAGTSARCEAFAPLYLPEGAIITRIYIFYYDNASADVVISFHLLRTLIGSYEFCASGNASTSGSDPYIQNIEVVGDDIRFNPVSSDYAYGINITWEPTNFSSNLRFYGARVYYTIDRAGN